MSTPRRLMARLRDLMARGTAPLPELVRLVAGELVSEVCSIYVMRPGEVLELIATEGLRPEAIGVTRLRVGEGIVGLAAATQAPLNLADAQNHPGFAWRPETGEDGYASMLAIPVRRGGRTIGIIAVQNRAPRHYDADEVEVVETVAMLVAGLLAAGPEFDRAKVIDGLNSLTAYNADGLINPINWSTQHTPPTEGDPANDYLYECVSLVRMQGDGFVPVSDLDKPFLCWDNATLDYAEPMPMSFND